MKMYISWFKNKKAGIHEKKNNEGGKDRNRYIIREKERMKRKIKRRVRIERVKKDLVRNSENVTKRGGHLKKVRGSNDRNAVAIADKKRALIRRDQCIILIILQLKNSGKTFIQKL